MPLTHCKAQRKKQTGSLKSSLSDWLAFADGREAEDLLELGASARDVEGERAQLTDWCCRKRVKAMLPWLQNKGITLELLRLIDTHLLRTALGDIATVSTLQKGLFLGVVKCLQKSTTETATFRSGDICARAAASDHVSHVDDCALISEQLADHCTLEPAIGAKQLMDSSAMASMRPLPPVHSAIEGEGIISRRLTLERLRKHIPTQRKRMISELLFPRVIQLVELRLAGKITGMLLELDNSVLLEMLYDWSLLLPKVSKALAVLRKDEAKAKSEEHKMDEATTSVHCAIECEGTSPRLTLKALRKLEPSMRKRTIGELLYPRIKVVQPIFAGKITGMLLELDNIQLLKILNDSKLLSLKIDKALAVLSDEKELLKMNAAERRQRIGELLYSRIGAVQPTLAGKITGMLLETDTSELLKILNDSALLSSKIKEAMAVLKKHESEQRAKAVSSGMLQAMDVKYPHAILTSSGKGLSAASLMSSETTQALATQINSLFACISHACAGLSYAKVALLAALSFKLAPPKNIECSDLTEALERVSLGSVYRFALEWIPTECMEESTKQKLRARVCAQIRNGQCVISNDSKGHYSLLYEVAAGSLFRMRCLQTSTEAETEVCVSLSSRKLLVFVSEDCSVKPLTDRQLFDHCLNRAVDANSVFMEMYTQMEEMGVGTAEERKHFEDLLECTLKAEGVAALHRLAESIEDGGVQLTQAIRSVQLFYDARIHVCHWLQRNFGLQGTVWNAELKLIKDADFGDFDASELSPESGVKTARCLTALLLKLAKMEDEVMRQLQVA